MSENASPKPSPAKPNSPVLRVGEGEFVLRGKLGRDRLAVRYRGESVQLQREVLVQVYAARGRDSHSQKLCRRVMEFRHPDAARVYACGENAQCRYLVQDFLAGHSLSEARGENVVLPLNQLVLIGIQLGKVLAAAHEAGVSHLRLRLEHVWIVGGRQLKLAGFGECLMEGGESQVSQRDFESGIRGDILDLARLLKSLIGDEKPFCGTRTSVSKSSSEQSQRQRLLGLLEAVVSSTFCRHHVMEDLIRDLERLNLAADRIQIKEWIEPPNGASGSLSTTMAVAPTMGNSSDSPPSSLVETTSQPVLRAPMDRIWLVSVAGEVRSSAGTSEIIRQLQDGDLRPTDLIKPSRGGAFQKIEEVADFADLVKSLTEQPPPKETVSLSPASVPAKIDSPRSAATSSPKTPQRPEPKATPPRPVVTKSSLPKTSPTKTTPPDPVLARAKTDEKPSSLSPPQKPAIFIPADQNKIPERVEEPKPTDDDPGDDLILVRVPLLEPLVVSGGQQPASDFDGSDEELILVSAPPKPVLEKSDGRAITPKRQGIGIGGRWGMVLLVLLLVGGVNASLLIPVQSEEAKTARRRERGYVSKVYQTPQGEEYYYSLFIPYYLKETDRPPVILHLHGGHGGSGNGRNLIGSLIGQTVWPLRQHYPFIVIFPQAKDGHGQWAASRENAQMAIGVLEEVIRDYGADEDRVFLAGASSGGAGVWDIASALPDRFAAIIPICSAGLHGSVAATVDDLAQIIADHNLQVWSGANLGDGPAVNAFNEGIRSAMLQRGRSPFFIRYAETGHNAWDNTYHNPAMYAWLLKQSRQRNQGNDPLFTMLSREEEPAGAFEIQQGRVIPGERNAFTLETLDYDHWPRLILKEQPAEFDLHFDISLDRAGGFRIWFGSPDDNVENGYVAVVMRPDEGNGGLKEPASLQWSQSSNSYAESSLQVSFNDQLPGWNDVRLSVKEGKISLQINGWYAFQQEISSGSPVGNVIAIELIPQNKQIRSEQAYQEAEREKARNPDSQSGVFGQRRPPFPAIQLQDIRIRGVSDKGESPFRKK